MIETLTCTIIMAFLTGATGLAFKYPRSYYAVNKKVQSFAIACALFFLAYLVGVTWTAYKINSFIDETKKTEAVAAFNSLLPPSLWWLFLPIAILLYLHSLILLPYLFSNENEKRTDQQQKGKQ